MAYPKNSKLISRLTDQKNSIFPAGNNYLTIFECFSGMVELELKQINQLFEEYTPHDDTHMESLFRITDELLGDSINSLNGCEACILACAIYGHDWGMAVSNTEKDKIINFEDDQTDYALLPDEKPRWIAYCKKNGINHDASGKFKADDITIDVWRGYVRDTHSERANARCNKYFEGDLSPLGSLIGEVCDAHWYNIEDIRCISNSVSVAGLTINLRALATYIRFIDLLDIGSNRTPYALWKFINPSNDVSKTEWKKHQSINPITFKPTVDVDSKRILQIHGMASDIETYSALQDMKRYITKQVKENSDLLRGEREKSLGDIEIDWDVKTNGSFEPIDIRFEFDREGMFRLLSSEIYDDDPYVFIRELVQNAIDATQLRAQRHLKENTGIQLSPEVNIKIEHQQDGNAIFEITDSGVGMTTDIVKNYLAVLGKSYYRSKDYLSLSLDMQPISKFGVGLFSCFEVADKLLITTGTDPYLGDKENLEIEISNSSQQFRVKKLSSSNMVGTSIRVYLKGLNWRKADFCSVDKLDFTKYLKDVASVVKFPLNVDEDGVKTKILPPTFSGEVFKSDTYPDTNLSVKSSDSWLNTVVDPDDRYVANKVFTEKRKNFSINHQGLLLEGVLQDFELSENVLYWSRGTSRGIGGIGGRGHTYTLKEQGGISRVEIHSLDTANYHPKSNLSKSTKHSVSCAIYMNGFLLPEQKLYIWSADSVPTPRLTLNITQAKEVLSISLSRMNVKESLDHLSEIINNKLLQDYGPKSFEGSLIDKFAFMTRGTHSVRNDHDLEGLPMIKLLIDGELEFIDFESLPEKIDLSPKYYFKSQKQRAGWPPENGQWPPKTWLNVPLKNAENIVDSNIPMLVSELGMEYDDGSCMGWNTYETHSNAVIRKHYINLSYRLGVVNNEPYIIERKTAIETTPTVEVKHQLLDTYSIEFSIFEGKLNEYVGVLRLENNQLSENRLHKIILNRNNDSVVIFENTIQRINNSSDDFDEECTRKIRKLYSSLPFIGSTLTYRQETDYSQFINDWMRSFCFGCADLSLITLNEYERSALKGAKKSIVCRE